MRIPLAGSLLFICTLYLTAGWPQAYPWTRTTPRPSTPCGLHSIHQHTSDLQLGTNPGNIHPYPFVTYET